MKFIKQNYKKRLEDQIEQYTLRNRNSLVTKKEDEAIAKIQEEFDVIKAKWMN